MYIYAAILILMAYVIGFVLGFVVGADSWKNKDKEEKQMIYTVKLRRYKKGAYGATIYQFPVRVRASCFAEGYFRCLRDIGINDIYVSVHDEKGVKLLEIQ